MRIKKSPDGNEYIYSGDMWVRNFTKSNVPPLGLTNIYSKEDYDGVLSNENKNNNYMKIHSEKITMNNIIIVSDGFDFNNKHLSISKFPKNVNILAVNRALKNWQLMSQEDDRSINAYVANNPFGESMSYLPRVENQYFPACIASSKTNFQFLKKYSGDKYIYQSTPQRDFSTCKSDGYYIDDYRNVICAAIGLAYQFGVKKLMLLSCDDSFEKEKDFATQLPNGLWTYPQHIRSQKIIDANLYWLTHQEDNEVQVCDWSDGLKYEHASYISNENDAISFFQEEEPHD